jgi:pimeloyl-ACP methyl ester carboxylesterase
MNLSRLILFAACISLIGCVHAPAKLRRVIGLGMDKQAPLHDLLSAAVNQPESADGKRALGHFIERWQKEEHRAEGRVSAPDASSSAHDYHVVFESSEFGAYPLSYFDQISLASDFEIQKLKHHQRAGVGTPLTALRENKHRDAIENYYPPEAITRPLTGLARLGPLKDGIQEVRISLLCPLVNSTVRQQGQQKTLAADFSVPWAALLARSGKLNQSRVLDMLTRTPKRQPQLYLMEPYDPKKEPLIMIHGLLSTPLAWAESSNEIWSNDQIRQRYQIWHYLYNTSAPALYSARLLRTQLQELRHLLDPEGDDPAMQKTTLLTHSMGGLVGKALAVKPEKAFWQAAFKVPHETLSLSAADRAQLQDAFEWQPDPTIRRIIFIAVPHRGSSYADNAVGRIGSWITHPPSQFQAFYQRISQLNPGVFTAAYQALGQGKLDSVGSLSPRQPTLRILAELPFRKGLQVHSIIGDRGKPGPLEKSSDGIVPYTSSHLDQATSELIVPAGHGAFRHPAAIAEVKRLLLLE